MPATLSILTNVFTDPSGAGPGDRAVGRRVRPRGGDRPAGRRLPARALLVGIDLPGQRPPIVIVTIVGAVVFVPELAGRARAAPRRPRHRAVDRRPDHAALRHHRGPDARAGPIRSSSAAFVVAVVLLTVVRAAGSATPTTRSSTSASSPTHGSPRRRSRSRSCSSPCSARCSSSASTCSSCSATRALESGVAPAADRRVADDRGAAERQAGRPVRHQDRSSPLGLLLVAVGAGAVLAVSRHERLPAGRASCWSSIGVGMGLAMAPATESIMGSLPPEKAGVGSAMNDTTREIGGALGVAIIGSITAAGLLVDDHRRTPVRRLCRPRRPRRPRR